MAAPFKLVKIELDNTPYVVDPETAPFFLEKMLDVPNEVQQFQTCLRSWFVAYVKFFEDASATCEELAHDAIVYQVLDDMLISMLAYSINPERTGDDYQNIFLEPLRIFSSGLSDERKIVRNWFADFVSSFEERADELTMKTHVYAFTTIDEYLQTYIAQRHKHILDQLTTA